MLPNFPQHSIARIQTGLGIYKMLYKCNCHLVIYEGKQKFRDSFITLQKIIPPCHCLSISISDPNSFAISHLQADYFGLIHLHIADIILTMLTIKVF